MSDLIILSSESKSVQHLCIVDAQMAFIVQKVGEISYVPHTDSFAFLADTIIGQMLSNKVADILSGRLRNLCSRSVTPETIIRLGIDDFRNIGIARTKASYIIGLAEQVLRGGINFDIFQEASDNDIIKKLTSVKGIGMWSAKMYLIFVLNRQDVLPFEDNAFLQSFAWAYGIENCKPEEIIAKCAIWCPYSSIASRYLYRALDMGLTRGKTGYPAIDGS